MNDKIKGVVYLGIIVLFVVLIYYFCDKNNINIYNNDLIKLLNNRFDYVAISNTSNNLKINKNIDILNIMNLNYQNIKYIPNNEKITNTIMKEENKTDVSKDKEEYNYPIVYIYNTHNKEEYYYDKNAPYNIVPTVINTSYILQEVLKKNNIYSIVEEGDVSSVLKKNGWNYASSYKVTRLFLESAKNKNPTLKYFIDVHRDSVKKNITTIEINGVNYARILFILGLENKDYEKNNKMIEYINNEINKTYPKLSRGIYKKEGKGVNGIYNQDFSPNCILIEFGGIENTIDEISNTVNIVGNVLSKYIGENNENN